MPQTGEGAWVRFRVHIVRAPGFAGGTFASPHAAGQTLLKVTGISPVVGGSDDSAARSGIDDEGREYVDSYVVRVEVGRAVPGNAFESFETLLKGRLRDPVRACAGKLWVAVMEELDISESPSIQGRPPGRDTGELAQSIGIALDEDGLGAAVGSELDYALFLEFGTRRMAARPFLFPALERIKPVIEAKITRAARAALDNVDLTRVDPTHKQDLEVFEAIMDILKSGGEVGAASGGRVIIRDSSSFLSDTLGALRTLATPVQSDPEGGIGVR